jgi:lysozyme family protein
MADFDTAINFVLANEGGFVDDANDPGGATNFGLSLRFLRGIPAYKDWGIDDVRHLTRDNAVQIYREHYWTAAPFEKIPSQQIANYVFDMAINHGTAQAVKILQRSVWSLHQQRAIIADDGVLGDKTILALGSGVALAFILPAERAGFMRLLAAIKPSNMEFLNGWLNRCYRI